MYKSDSIKEMSAALAAFHADPDLAPIKKDVDGHHGKYADLTAVFKVIRPLLAKHNLVPMQTPANKGPLVAAVETSIIHGPSGEYISGTIEMPVARQNDPQAFGSALTYARRYSILCMLGLVTEDDDGQSATVTLEDILRDMSRCKTAEELKQVSNEHSRRYVSDKLWNSVCKLVEARMLESFATA